MKEDSYLKILNRLKRLEGQIRGIQGMIQKNTSEEQTLVQIKAAKSALSGIEELLLFSVLYQKNKEEQNPQKFIHYCLDLLKKHK